jgi:endonuclease-3
MLNINKLIDLLEKEYPDAKLELNYQNPFQLLIAAILAAQCTDKKVNEVTKSLFNKYKNPEAFANADPKELEKDIKPTGFYKNKAKNIIQTSKIIVEKYNSTVPEKKEQLMQLSGVADKTANMLLCNAFNIPSGIVVDTHVKRLAYRIGLTKNTDPKKIEEDLKKIIPRSKWIKFPHLLAFHGRKICIARKPKCKQCVINQLCNYKDKNID